MKITIKDKGEYLPVDGLSKFPVIEIDGELDSVSLETICDIKEHLKAILNYLSKQP